MMNVAGWRSHRPRDGDAVRLEEEAAAPAESRLGVRTLRSFHSPRGPDAKSSPMLVAHR